MSWARSSSRFQQGDRAARRTEDYLRRSGLDIKLDHGVDNMAMAISLVASTRGLALMPAYAKNLLPWSVVSRPLEGQAPTIDLAVGYTKSNTSPTLQLFLSRLDKPTSWWAEPEALTPRITSPPEGQLLRGSLTRYVVTYTARSTLGEDVLMTDYTEIGYFRFKPRESAQVTLAAMPRRGAPQ
ncbi:MAG: LysR substrate-binding domain-containing protein [Pseudonocardiaceae bacterium]